MQVLQSTILFALASVMYTSASILSRDGPCVGEGVPCQNIVQGLLECCDGLQCNTLLGLVGLVIIASQNVTRLRLILSPHASANGAHESTVVCHGAHLMFEFVSLLTHISFSYL